MVSSPIEFTFFEFPIYFYSLKGGKVSSITWLLALAEAYHLYLFYSNRSTARIRRSVGANVNTLVQLLCQ